MWIDEVICQFQFGLESWDAVAQIDWHKVSLQLFTSGFVKNHFHDIDNNEIEKNKAGEIQQYIQSIIKNPIFINHMLTQKEEYPILPNSF